MSQIATTIEQSKRLIEAGLDPKSADMSYFGHGSTVSRDEDEYDLGLIPYGPHVDKLQRHVDNDRADLRNYGLGEEKEIEIELIEDMIARTIPAWSLSRLWDICNDSGTIGWFSLASDTSEDVIEELICMIENRHANH